MKKKWLLLILILGLLAILFIIGWIPHYTNNQKIEALAKENPLPEVSVLRLERNLKPIELVLPTSAQAYHITPIWARVNGYLIRYLADIGDAVKAGDLLAEIDTPETDEDLARAKADLANSIAQRDIAKITSERWQRLWDKNIEAVSKQEVDQYNANLKAADAVVLANEKNVSRLTYQQQFKNIYAPFDGIITQRLIDIGHLIYGSVNGTPQELFEIADNRLIRFYVEVPQTYFRQIEDGLNAEITVNQLPDRIFKGSVTRFAKALDPTARTLLTEVDVENTDSALYPGVYAQVKLLMQPDTINFIIPTTALIIRSGYPHIATLDDNNIVHMKKVQIGRDYGNQVEITDGLKENDLIVAVASDKIKEGVKVAIIPPAGT